MSVDPSSDRQAAPARARQAAAVRLPAEVTFANAGPVLEQALAGLDAALPLFDLSACRHFDSSLIGVLLELARRASAAGRRYAFVGASANLRKLSGLYGVEELLFGEEAGGGAAVAGSGG